MKFKRRVRWPWWYILVHDWSLTVARFWALSSGVHVVNLRSKQYILIFSALKNICKSTFSTFQHFCFQFYEHHSLGHHQYHLDRSKTNHYHLRGFEDKALILSASTPPRSFSKTERKTIIRLGSDYYGRGIELSWKVLSWWFVYTFYTLNSCCIFMIIAIARMVECLEQ